ncbi:TerB-like protein [Fontibacillus phaseoli]|uniref:TerB-like protein n=1 Tax=Fontibacillus phaseoli TaxID=1416533 RepID=A0A369BIN4_9BACL|nr:TerB N-terminal domain-containing protein [Fontibacillus phaseoli]RCX21452.1 TerB-like protein [Fontibacillus phaseoli]
MNDRTDKHYIHIDNNKQRMVRDRQLTFAEMELGVPGQPETEPVSKVVAPESESLERNLDWRQDFRYVSKEQQFVQTARELEGKSEEYAEFVPFQTYWPTYDQMQPGQLRWYLYWRGEVRSGRYPETDMSYLFVYLYELIHGIGWDDPVHGVELMDRVWKAYRKRYPKLDLYVREWMYDLGKVFGLDMPPAEPLMKLPRSLSNVLKELEWGRRFSAEPLELTWEMVLPLIDYEVEKSRYYSDQGRKEMRHYVPKVIALVDGFLAKTKGSKLIERFKPKEKKITRFLFRSAVYDHEVYGHGVPVSVLPISEHPPFRAYLTQLVRHTENKLRELTGFKGKLRGISLEPEVEQLVSRFLHKEFGQRQTEEAKSRIPVVKINTAKLRKLQQESNEVRDMLLTEELSIATVEQKTERPTGSSGQKGARQLKRDVPQQAEMDFELGWRVFEEEPSAHSQPEGFKELNELPEAVQLEIAESSAGDDCEQRSEGSEELHKERIRIEGPIEPKLAEEWQEMSVRLSGAHLAMLGAIVEERGIDVRYGIAEQAGSMPELLLDEINELAMEWIGDLLIDGDRIAEEYETELRNMLQCSQIGNKDL